MNYEKNIKVDEETWLKLTYLKLGKKMKNLSEVIKFLVEEHERRS